MATYQKEAERLFSGLGDKVSTFMPARSCVYHNKIWVVRGLVAAVVTYNGGKISPTVDFGVLVPRSPSCESSA